MGNRIGSWGDAEPAYYISAAGKETPDFAARTVTIMNPDGGDGGDYSAAGFLNLVTHRETDYSYAGKTSCREEVIRDTSPPRM